MATMYNITRKKGDKLEVIPLEEMFAGIFKIIHLSINIHNILFICAVTACNYTNNNCYIAYCNMDPISHHMNVLSIPLSQSNKWLISAHILDMDKLTTTNTGLAFFKFRKRALSYEEYLTYLKDLAISYNLNFEDMKYRLQTSGKPSNIHDNTKTT